MKRGRCTAKVDLSGITRSQPHEGWEGDVRCGRAFPSEGRIREQPNRIIVVGRVIHARNPGGVRRAGVGERYEGQCNEKNNRSIALARLARADEVISHAHTCLRASDQTITRIRRTTLTSRLPGVKMNI